MSLKNVKIERGHFWKNKHNKGIEKCYTANQLAQESVLLALLWYLD